MNRLKYILPPLVLVLGVVAAAAMIRSRPPAPVRDTRTPPPVVRAMLVQLGDHQFRVATQGTVEPRTRIDVVAEVSGRVVRVSPSMVSGGFFESGEVLATIEPLDYEAAVERARADVERADLRLAQERAQADVARREWDRLGDAEPTPLTLREPQIAEARASVTAARAALKQAERNLERTRIRLPFAGRVSDESVDRGQYVTRGSRLAGVYATDYAEVRLPLSGDDAGFIDLPWRSSSAARPSVEFTATFGGKTQSWVGHIVRLEGEIDPRTRVIYAVARIDDPFSTDDSHRVPLAVGQFVNAAVAGRTVSDVAVLPRSAVRNGNQVLIVDDETRLRIRAVSVVRFEGDDAVIDGGLRSGERVCLTSLDAVVDGMEVRVKEPPGAAVTTRGEL